MAKGHKYTSFAAQRESCRLNKFAYTEKIEFGGGAKLPILFCNYPFLDPSHKKGLCKASTCTDLRQIPSEVVEADTQGTDDVKAVPTCDQVDATTLADSGAGEQEKETADDMACPDNG